MVARVLAQCLVKISKVDCTNTMMGDRPQGNVFKCLYAQVSTGRKWIYTMPFPTSRGVYWEKMVCFNSFSLTSTGSKCPTQGHPRASKGTLVAPWGHPMGHTTGQKPQCHTPGPNNRSINKGPRPGHAKTSQARLRVMEVRL